MEDEQEMIAIKGMEMPKGCVTCPFMQNGTYKQYCMAQAGEQWHAITGMDCKTNEELNAWREATCPLMEIDPYWEGVMQIYSKQSDKGLREYEMRLYENTSLSQQARLNHLAEELVDALMYIQHIKAGMNGAEDDK